MNSYRKSIPIIPWSARQRCQPGRSRRPSGCSGAFCGTPRTRRAWRLVTWPWIFTANETSVFLGFFHCRCIFSVFGSMIILEAWLKAEVAKIGHLEESLVVVIHGWQRDPTDGSKGGWSVGLSICLSIYLSVCLSIYLSICLFIYLSTYLPI